MKIFINEPRLDLGLDDLQNGDFFRFTNGKNTKRPFLVLGRDAECHNRSVSVRDLERRKDFKIYITNKERKVTMLEVTEMHFSDTGVLPTHSEDPIDVRDESEVP